MVAVRAIKNKGTLEFGKLQLTLLEQLKKNEISRVEAQYKAEEYWAGGLRRAVQEGDIEYGSLMAGQSVGLVNEIKSVKQIIQDLLAEAEEEFNHVQELLN